LKFGFVLELDLIQGFVFQFRDIDNLANFFFQNLAKLVEITVENQTIQSFPNLLGGKNVSRKQKKFIPSLY